MEKKNDILIIGAGELGRALEFVLKKSSNNEVSVWDKNKDKIESWKPFDEAVVNKEVVFLAIPTVALEEAINQIPKNDDAVLVVLSKGLNNSGLTPVEIVEKKWTGKIVNISGPMIAEEVVAGKEAEASISGKSKESIDKVISLFRSTSLELEKVDDFIGISWLGPLKNVYAIGMGMTDGYGNNHRGCYLTYAINEMGKIVEFWGGKKETVLSLAGIGDLVATGFSSDSSNFQLGKDLAKGEKKEKISEGVTVAIGMNNRLGDKLNQWPLLSQIVAEILKLYH